MEIRARGPSITSSVTLGTGGRSMGWGERCILPMSTEGVPIERGRKEISHHSQDLSLAPSELQPLLSTENSSSSVRFLHFPALAQGVLSSPGL